MADVRQPADGGLEATKPEVKKQIPVTVKTITPTVFLTGQYNTSPEAKAKELTSLMQKLLAPGIWRSAQDAANEGIPKGTFIIVDDPRTPGTEFSVEVVPAINKKG